MNTVTAFHKATFTSKCSELRDMVVASIIRLEETLQKEKSKLYRTEELKRQKSSELQLLYSILDGIHAKFLKCRKAIRSFSAIEDKKLSTDTIKYEKRLGTILKSIERAENEFKTLLDTLDSCLETLVNKTVDMV